MKNLELFIYLIGVSCIFAIIKATFEILQGVFT